MKALLIKSNHGNHRGFNRQWTILNAFYNLDDALIRCAELHNEIKEIWDESSEDHEIAMDSFEDDLIYYHVVTQEDYDRGLFNGGHFGYASNEIINYFEEG